MMQTNKALTFNLGEVARMFARLDELTRENLALQTSLEVAVGELENLKTENADLLRRLADLESYYAWQRTRPIVVNAKRCLNE